MAAKAESVRMPADLATRIREVAEETGGTSDVLRDAALAYLGQCPTCGHRLPDRTGGGR